MHELLLAVLRFVLSLVRPAALATAVLPGISRGAGDEVPLVPPVEVLVAVSQVAVSVVEAGGAVTPITQLDEGTFRRLALEEGWEPATLDDLVVVARCESNLRPDAVNGGALGLLQLMPVWFAYAGESLDAWADPRTNLRAALGAYRYSGDTFRQWECRPR